MKTTVVISRSIDGSGPERALENSLADQCSATSGVDILLVPHIYHLPEDSDVWTSIAASPGSLVVVTWLHTRPAESLLLKYNIRPELTLNMTAFENAEACFAAIDAAIAKSESPSEVVELTEQVDSRWYPVMDISRCIRCGHCLQFCLFDVYVTDPSGVISVQNPDSCKPGCPACSRVCPESAIMFPLYLKDDAIAGAPGEFVTPDPSTLQQLKQRGEMKKETRDDIDLLIDDLENLTRRKQSP
jgi:Pyruvate/2-oxoacid:ferredoxin oxidoreductase delta subunit